MYITFPECSFTSYFMTTMAITRVLLADDDSLVRLAIRRVLAAYPEMEVVGEATTGIEAVSSVERLRPHRDHGYPHATNGWNRCVSGIKDKDIP